MLQAKDIMTREVITVQTSTPVREVAETLWTRKIGGAPVLDETGRLVGVVTESDLIDQNKKIHIPTMISVLDSVIYLENPNKFETELKKMSGAVAGDICSKKLVTVGEDTPLDEVATIMATKKVHTLPVLNAEGRLAGVIGKTDIIRTMASKS